MSVPFARFGKRAVLLVICSLLSSAATNVGQPLI